MVERILEIEVPESILDPIKGPFQEGDPIVRGVVKEEVDRVIEALRFKGVIQEEDDISVAIRGNSEVLSTSPVRRVKVIQVFRESDDGKGAIDTLEEVYSIEMSPSTDN